MKKQYKIIVTVVTCVAVFLCCGLTVGAERILPSSGYTNIEYASGTVTRGSETTSFSNSGNQLPLSANYFGYSGPFYFTLDIVNFDVPSGYYVIFEVQSYLSSVASREGTYSPVSSRDKLVKCSFSYLADAVVGIYGMTDKGQSEHGDSYHTVVLNNNTGGTLTVDAIRVGVPTAGTLPAAYAYYLKVNYIRYKILSSDEYNALMSDIETGKIIGEIQDSTDQITGEIQESTDQITNGWEPDPEIPEGGEVVDDYAAAEDELLADSLQGIDEFNYLITSNEDGGFFSWVNGFAFIIQLWQLLVTFEWIHDLLYLSLQLGVMAFFLNIVGVAGSSVGRVERAARREAEKQKKQK